MKHVFISIFKEAFDKAIAIVALIIFSPVFIIISVLIKLDSRGPVFFVQERAGVKGKLFNSIKFRTMVHKAVERGLGLNIRAGDERITRIGRLLRSWSLDELPQLINVLKGDMSIVGPRPTLPYQVEQYDDFQRRRLLVKPGITGWARVNGRNAISWEQRIKLDVWYVQTGHCGWMLRSFSKQYGWLSAKRACPARAASMMILYHQRMIPPLR